MYGFFRDYTGAVFSVDANRSKNSNEFSLNAHPRFALKIIVIFVSNSERKRF